MNLPNNANSALARYGAVKVSTCTPGQLLLMLYDALFRFLREAMAAMEVKDRARVGERTGRSHAILVQLLGGLDRNISPKLCDLLQPLYIFCMNRVVEANLKQDPALLGEIIRVLTPLRETWGEAVAKVDANGG